MAEHTTGPWRSLSPRTAGAGTVTGWIVGAEPDEDAPTVAWIEEVQPADLRLMVAAPELLAALTALAMRDLRHDGSLCWCDGAVTTPLTHKHDEDCQQARAAISKARGAIS